MAKKGKKVTDETDRLAEVIIEGIKDLKGHEIVKLDLRQLPNAVCNCFIIATGNSNTQVEAISGSVEEKVRVELGEKPWHVEGSQNAEWILIDYVTVVVHIFQPEARLFYNIEKLWADAEVTRIDD